jgi:uncharacterized protein YeaO (DUF488 family)
VLQIQRIYDELGDGGEDTRRILVDRLWPRGLTKEKARLDHWAKACAPSNELRKWYGHDPAKWDEFRARYFAELDRQPEAVAELAEHLAGGDATLLYSSKEAELNNAVALKEYLERAGLIDG